jgi:hypothetical protein
MVLKICWQAIALEFVDAAAIIGTRNQIVGREGKAITTYGAINLATCVSEMVCLLAHTSIPVLEFLVTI